MNRNFEISKYTEDKVKLAKQYIQNKYQTIIENEISFKNNWEKIIKVIKKSQLQDIEKKKLQKTIIQEQNIKKRQFRQKDSLQNYELHKIIGKGAFGQVRLAKNIVTNEMVAIKRMDKKRLIGKKQVSSVYLERQFLIKNNSKYLVELKSTFQDKKYLYIVMQYVAGGDLLHLLIEKDIFNQEETTFYIAELILAIQQIHNMNFIHRDIKPDNILIAKNGHIKISDFGLSKYVKCYLKQLQKNGYDSNLTKIASIRKNIEQKQRKNRKFSKVGTPDYISPQILTDETYDHTVDIWSIGVIMFECVFGYPPFSHEDSTQVCHRVIRWNQYLQFPEDVETSLEAKMLILGMMCDKQERLSIKQIKSHPFFIGLNWENIYEMKPPNIPKIEFQLDTTNFQQFQETIPWITSFQDKNDLKNESTRVDFLHHRRKSSSLGYKYNFAGFDYIKKVQNDILNDTMNKISQMQKGRIFKSKSPTSKKLKRIHIQQVLDNATFRKQKWKQIKNDLICKSKKSFKSIKQIKSIKENVQQEQKKIGMKKLGKCLLLKKISSKVKNN